MIQKIASVLPEPLKPDFAKSEEATPQSPGFAEPAGQSSLFGGSRRDDEGSDTEPMAEEIGSTEDRS